MPNKHILSKQDVIDMIDNSDLASQLKNRYSSTLLTVYGVPRGGQMVAHFVAEHLNKNGFRVDITFDAKVADLIVDDLIDSGATQEKYGKEYPSVPFFALFTKKNEDWIVFPWEAETEASGPEDNVVRLLEFMGEDPNREGLLETPKRVLKAWDHWTSGYNIEPADILKTFEDGAEGDGEMVIVRDIPIYSKCEHHLADIIGKATIAYIPHGKIVGLSKLNRLVDIYARRLQVQERLTTQTADAIVAHLSPDCAVHIRARHMCMESRGVCQHGHSTVTSALRGVFKTQAETRAEFYSNCSND